MMNMDVVVTWFHLTSKVALQSVTAPFMEACSSTHSLYSHACSSGRLFEAEYCQYANTLHMQMQIFIKDNVHHIHSLGDFFISKSAEEIEIFTR